MTSATGQQGRTLSVEVQGARSRRSGLQVRRTLHRALIALSLVAVIVILKISFDHPIIREEVPVFHAKALPFWHRPTDQGGAQAKFTGFALNRIISGDMETGAVSTLNLAPQQQGLPAEVMSPRGLRALQRGTVRSPVTDDEIKAAVTAVPGTATTGELDPSSLDIENVIADILSAQSGTFSGLEVMPDSVLSGTYVAQVGIFSEREQAANRLIEILKSFPDSLGAMDWMIEPFILGNRNSHRLRFLGFSRFDEAETFCQKLVSRGVQCVPTIVF